MTLCIKHDFDFKPEVYPNGCPICLSEKMTEENQWLVRLRNKNRLLDKIK